MGYSKIEQAGPAGSPQGDEFYYQASRPRRRNVYHALAYSSLIFLNLALLGLLLGDTDLGAKSKNGDSCVRPQLVFSGPRESGATIYERRRLFRSLKDNPFTGDPRPEYDEAWRDIIEPMTVRITPEEYERADLGADTLAMRDGSGYVGEMAVYHELHCIKRLRRYLHLDYYNVTMTADERQFEDIHIDHCLEYWREAAMCRGDPSMTTMFWRDGLPTSRAYSDHECANWEALDTWARSRMLDMRDPEILDQTDRWRLISTPDARTVLRDHPEIEVHP